MKVYFLDPKVITLLQFLVKPFILDVGGFRSGISRTL